MPFYWALRSRHYGGCCLHPSRYPIFMSQGCKILMKHLFLWANRLSIKNSRQYSHGSLSKGGFENHSVLSWPFGLWCPCFPDRREGRRSIILEISGDTAEKEACLRTCWRSAKGYWLSDSWGSMLGRTKANMKPRRIFRTDWLPSSKTVTTWFFYCMLYTDIDRLVSIYRPVYKVVGLLWLIHIQPTYWINSKQCLQIFLSTIGVRTLRSSLFLTVYTGENGWKQKSVQVQICKISLRWHAREET